MLVGAGFEVVHDFTRAFLKIKSRGISNLRFRAFKSRTHLPEFIECRIQIVGGII